MTKDQGRRMNYIIVIQRDEDGRFNVSCPELKGCHSFGDTAEDAMKNIREAIALYTGLEEDNIVAVI